MRAGRDRVALALTKVDRECGPKAEGSRYLRIRLEADQPTSGQRLWKLDDLCRRSLRGRGRTRFTESHPDGQSARGGIGRHSGDLESRDDASRANIGQFACGNPSVLPAVVRNDGPVAREQTDAARFPQSINPRQRDGSAWIEREEIKPVIGGIRPNDGEVPVSENHGGHQLSDFDVRKASEERKGARIALIERTGGRGRDRLIRVAKISDGDALGVRLPQGLEGPKVKAARPRPLRNDDSGVLEEDQVGRGELTCVRLLGNDSSCRVKTHDCSVRWNKWTPAGAAARESPVWRSIPDDDPAAVLQGLDIKDHVGI